MTDPARYEGRLRAMLGDKRFRHSLCVRDMAVRLAERCGADPERAALAGLLHDICHDMAGAEQLKYLEAHGILLDALTLEHPPLWHAPCGAVYLREELGIADEAVLAAVRWHTTGRAGMTLLERAVFAADAVAMDRDYPGVEARRALAEASLDACVLDCLRWELERLARAGKTIVRASWEAYNWLAGRTRDLPGRQ